MNHFTRFDGWPRLGQYVRIHIPDGPYHNLVGVVVARFDEHMVRVAVMHGELIIRRVSLRKATKEDWILQEANRILS